MSLKAELDTWAAALKAYDEEDFEKSLQLFSNIADSSKILTNIGLIYATLGEHEAAVEQFTAATQLDQYLAVAYFQCGVSNFLLARYDLAYRDFDEALLYLRGNRDINYEQLGLKFKLYSAEVLFNKGLSQIYMGQMQQGLVDLGEARREKATDEHNVIDDAIQDRGEGYTVFSIPVGVLYRPSEKKLKNSTAKDYMGKAKLVAAEDASEAYTEFTGVARMKQGISPSGVLLDNPGLARAATVANPAPPPKSPDDVRPMPLQRSKTTINVATGPSRPGPSSPSSPATVPNAVVGGAVGLTRSVTSGGRTMAAPLGGGPTRGLSIRKTGSPGAPPSSYNPPQPPAQRVTEFYDEYLDSYSEDPLPPLPEQTAGPMPMRAGTMTRGKPMVAGAGAGLVHSRSRSAPQSQSQSIYSDRSGGSMRRRPTRRGTNRDRAPPRGVSAYEEDEEGYVSGDYDDEFNGMIKIRVKVCSLQNPVTNCSAKPVDARTVALPG
ncbi:hypothetical protein AcW1_003595 [Taiwanofungus camphoratus]|nr:hypothetical protein AcW1_003595 [Antrodia cinnamomea]